jgi:oligoendopeptidase F
MEQMTIKPREPFDWKSVEPFYQKLLGEDLTAERVPSWLQEWSELEKIVYEAHASAQRAKHANTADEIAEKAYLAFIENVLPHTSRLSQKLTQKLLAVDYQPLPEHEEMLKRFRNQAELFREENIAVNQAIETLISEYEKFNGALIVELDGEKLTIPQTSAKMQEPDRALRERAWRGVMAAQTGSSRELDRLFLELIRRRHDLTKNANLDNYRSYAWKNFSRFDYTPEDCLEFINSVEYEVTPVLSEIWGKRKKQLAIDEVRPWDLYADPHSRSPLKPFNTVKELEDGLERIFTNLDPVLGQQFASMRDGWLDLTGRPNKLSGIGYTMDFPVSKMPFIYHNVNGTNTDVWIMLHEIGHAFQCFACDENLIWNRWPSTEFCEVASQAMELLTCRIWKRKGWVLQH